MELIIASSNLHKIRELKTLLKPFKKFDLLSLSQFPELTLPEETGDSFQEIAEQKALSVAKILKKLVIADDTGLIVPALDGKPGIFSRRFAGDKATDRENRQKLLKEMGHLKGEARQAYYECCLAVASPNGLIKSVTATCDGYILTEEKGRLGFGYDSIFLKRDYDKSFGEMSEQTKNRISHRSKALDKLSVTLENLQRSCTTL